MAHRPLYGHHALRKRLAASAHERRLPASLLFQGPRGIGKQRLAIWLGQLLLCERATQEGLADPCGACQHCRYAERGMHPDLHWFFPRPKPKDSEPSPDDMAEDLAETIAERMKAEGLWAPSHGLEGLHMVTIRALLQQASLRPAMARHAVFIVGDAERMVSQEGSDQAANAFLKLLEEPTPGMTLILTSSEPGALLPTIRSRVVSVRVTALRREDTEAFVDDPAVRRHLGTMSRDDAIGRAGGAPGQLLAGDTSTAAFAAARRLLEAALQPSNPAGTAERLKAAARHGVSGARGAFSDMLDALTVLLHVRTRELVTAGRSSDARRTACAIPLVEETKLKAHGNVSPQLLGARLVEGLHRAMRP